MIGRQVGRWRILRQIGEGAHSLVFEGRAESEAVAIKWLVSGPAAVEEGDALRRFQREVVALLGLRHPAIVGFREYIHEDGSDQHFLVLEFMDRGTLWHELRAGPVPEAVLLVRALALLDGLGHAHACGLIHRDIKPSNLLLNSAGAIKLADFGVAKLRGVDSVITRRGLLAGTPEYMAPEALAAAPPSESSDLYALGLCLFEALVGQNPRPRGAHPAELARWVRARAHDFPPPVGRYGSAHPAWDPFFARMLAGEPEGRFTGAREAEGALRAVAREIGVTELDPASGSLLAPPAGPRRGPRGWPALLPETGEPRRIPLEQQMRIGRDHSCDLRVVGDSMVSREHARLFWQPETGRLLIEDLGSRNGTFVNGERVRGVRILDEGDVVRLGRSTFRLRYLS